MRWFLFSLCLTLMACNASKKSSKTPEKSVDTNGFSYNYGLLLGSSLGTQGLEVDSLDMDAIVAGLKASKDNPSMTKMDSAQQLVRDVMTKAQQDKAAKALEKNKEWLAENAKKKGVKTTDSGLQYEVLKEGTGPKPSLQDKVKTYYHGTLIDGTVFDSSVERGEPISFPLNGVIRGWQEGLQMMPVGSKWRLFIPAELGYGERPTGGIPPNSILIFEVELLDIVTE